MGAPDLLQYLRAAGLAVTANGDSLIVTPRERLTDNMRCAIRKNKAALLAALMPAPSSRPAPVILAFSREPEHEADHGEPWTGQELNPQDLNHARLIAMGLDDPKASNLADWMTQRQETGDDRIACFECKHFRPTSKRCSNHVKAQMPHELGIYLATMPQRCLAFSEAYV